MWGPPLYSITAWIAAEELNQTKIMAVDRTALIKGPARIVLGSSVFFSQGDVSVAITSETLPTTSSKWGKLDEILVETKHVVTFVPVGEWEELAVLFPLAKIAIGGSIFGAADVALTIVGSDGEQWAYQSAAVSDEPGIVAAIEGTLFEQVQLTCIRTNTEDWSDTDSLVAISSVTPPSDTEFSLAAIKRQAYMGSWGDDNWNSFDTEKGFRIKSAVQLVERKTDQCGLYDIRLSNYEADARFAPVGVTTSDLLAKVLHQGSGSARGASLAGLGKDLIVSAPGASVRLRGAALITGAGRFSAEQKRLGEVRAISTRAAFADPVMIPGKGEIALPSGVAPLVWFEGASAKPSRWMDYSANRLPATQTDATKQPTLATSGMPALKFDGVNDFLTCGTPALLTSGLTDYTAFAVIEGTAVVEATICGCFNGSVGWVVRMASGKPICYHIGSGLNTLTYPGSSLASAPWLLIMLSFRVGVGSEMRVNGGSSVTASTGLAAAPVGGLEFRIGAKGNNLAFMDKKIAEIILCGAISAPNIVAIETALLAKYSIS